MTVRATEVFSFIAALPRVELERFEASHRSFDAVRQSIYGIITDLQGADDAAEFSGALRRLISEWLTVPVPFDEQIAGSLRALGPLDDIGSRWGRDVAAKLAAALTAADALSGSESPVRSAVLTGLREYREAGRSFKIYCHRSARVHFQSLLASAQVTLPPESVFLHSAANYRDASPFDVLIKVGPLRSGGWGSAPDALVSAPRFRVLFQVVWHGCND
jgi:hypothetical protein